MLCEGGGSVGWGGPFKYSEARDAIAWVVALAQFLEEPQSGAGMLESGLAALRGGNVPVHEHSTDAEGISELDGLLGSGGRARRGIENAAVVDGPVVEAADELVSAATEAVLAE